MRYFHHIRIHVKFPQITTVSILQVPIGMNEDGLPNTSIPNNSNGHPSREASKATGKARGQVGIAIK